MYSVSHGRRFFAESHMLVVKSIVVCLFVFVFSCLSYFLFATPWCEILMESPLGLLVCAGVVLNLPFFHRARFEVESHMRFVGRLISSYLCVARLHASLNSVVLGSFGIAHGIACLFVRVCTHCWCAYGARFHLESPM